MDLSNLITSCMEPHPDDTVLVTLIFKTCQERINASNELYKLGQDKDLWVPINHPWNHGYLVQFQATKDFAEHLMKDLIFIVRLDKKSMENLIAHHSKKEKGRLEWFIPNSGKIPRLFPSLQPTEQQDINSRRLWENLPMKSKKILTDTLKPFQKFMK